MFKCSYVATQFYTQIMNSHDDGKIFFQQMPSDYRIKINKEKHYNMKKRFLGRFC